MKTASEMHLAPLELITETLPVPLMAFLFCLCGPTSLAQSWTQTGVPSNSWHTVAVSADGSKVVAAGDRVIYTSTNSGATWISNDVPPLKWYAVACSADGQRLCAGTFDVTNSLYTSSDSGRSWAPVTGGSLPPVEARWAALASSANGSKLIAINGYQSPSNPYCIYTSDDFGMTWRSNDVVATDWSSVATSADGTRLVAGCLNWTWYLHSGFGGDGSILTSTNRGLTWNSNWEAPAPWASVASSADGLNLVAVESVVNIEPVGSNGLNGIFTSTNSGIDWAQTGASSVVRWHSVASSADGLKLVAGAVDGIFTSSDSGSTWTSNNLAGLAKGSTITCVCSSADGNKLFAIPFGIGTILASESVPHPLLEVKSANNELECSWIVPSADFVLQESTGLTSLGWNDVEAQPTFDAIALKYRLTLPATNLQSFYRLAVH